MNIAAYSQRTNILIVYGSFSGSTKEIMDSMKLYLANESVLVETLPAVKKKIELSKFRDWEKIKKWTIDIAKYEKIISE